MVQYIDLVYAPDIDTIWAKNPGALTSINAFAPMQNGSYASMGNSAYLATITGSDIVKAQAFRQVNGSVRLLLFRLQNIDEYDSGSTRTNRGTGYSALTAMWHAAAWGNQIIACNLLDATQSSTGAGFTALGGSSPKARYVASNINFVMFGDVDDGGSNIFSDMVWWSGIRNPNTYAPSQATQAGYIRLLDVPGPLRGLVAFREMFIAFKDNGFMVGQYAGPPKLFSWRPGSQQVGCVGGNTIAELDGKLYWLHTSGFWCFDGQSLTNVGTPIFQTFLKDSGFITNPSLPDGLPGSTSPIAGLDDVQVSVDQVEGVIWWQLRLSISPTSFGYTVMYGYNPRSRKWGRYAFTISTAAGTSVLVRATTADMQTFKAATSNRIWMVHNTTATTVRGITYPAVAAISAPAISAPSFTTGVWGDAQQSARGGEVFSRHMFGSSALVAADVVGTWSRFQNEDQITSLGDVTATFNPEFNSLQGAADGKQKRLSVSYPTAKTVILGGLGLDDKATGKR